MADLTADGGVGGGGNALKPVLANVPVGRLDPELDQAVAGQSQFHGGKDRIRGAGFADMDGRLQIHGLAA